MTFRVIRNLAAGHGFVYNLGEHVFCTTAALYALLLAGFSALLRMPPIDFYLAFGAILSICNLFLIFFIGSSGGKDFIRGLSAALLFSVSWANLASALLGMETPLFVFLLLSSVAAALLADVKPDRRMFWKILSGGCAGLAAVTRPEGVFLATALVVHRLIPNRKIPWTEIFSILAMYLPWCAYALLNFGTIIPQSVHAKALGYYRSPHHAIAGMTRHFFDLFVFAGWGYTWQKPILGALLLLGVAGLKWGTKTCESLRILFLFNLIFIVAYAFANPLLFDWYLVPLEPGYIFALTFGFWSVIDLLKLKSNLVAFAIVILVWLSLMYQYALPAFFGNNPEQIPAAFLTIAQSDAPRHGLLRPLLSSEPREKLYQKIAFELADQITDQTRIMTPEFGALGYFSRAKFVSSLGHVNPEVMQFLPPKPEELGVSNNVITVREVRGLTPDYVISYQIFIEKTLLIDPWFKENYQEVAWYPVNIWNTPRLSVFKKRN